MFKKQATDGIDSRNIAVKKYFSRTPFPPTYVLPIALLVMAVTCLAVSGFIAYKQRNIKDENTKGCSGCALILVTAAGAGFIFLSSSLFAITRKRYLTKLRLAEPKPSDYQIDQWLNDNKNLVKTSALYKLDLLKEQIDREPLVVVGPGPSPRVRVGADRNVRFSVHDILVVYLTPYHLATYKCTMNLDDATIISESTQEYHYNDVVSVSTQSDIRGLVWVMDDESRRIPTFEKFALSVASGEQITIAISFPATEHLPSTTTFSETETRQAIRAIRTRLREKKGGTLDTDLDSRGPS
jgi:hypothetical protein